MVEPAGGDLAVGIAQQLGDCVDDGHQHGLGVLLDPAGAGVAERLLAARLRHRAQVLVVEHRLDGGVPSSMPSRSSLTC
jgi:hypothetical protein